MSTYYCTLLDSLGNEVALLDTPSLPALRYERRLNDVSAAQFTIRAGDPRVALISKHTWFEVYRSRAVSAPSVREQSYLVVGLDRFVEDDGQEWVIVSGVSLEWLLLPRFVDPRNDPSAAGGWSTKLAPVDVLMADLVSQQAGPGASSHGSTPSQQIPGLAVPTPPGVGPNLPFRRAWDSVLEVLQDLAEPDRMDFRIERTTGLAMAFRAERIGADRTQTTNYPGRPFTVLTPHLGTLRQPRLTLDWKDERTVVHLLGRGAGDNRELYGSMAGSWNETPYSYAAVVEDLRSADSASEYIEQAQEVLAKHRAKKSFTFEVERGAETYGVLWDLGDCVTVDWGDMSEEMRITAVTVELTGDGETITPDVRGRYPS